MRFYIQPRMAGGWRLLPARCRYCLASSQHVFKEQSGFPVARCSALLGVKLAALFICVNSSATKNANYFFSEVDAEAPIRSQIQHKPAPQTRWAGRFRRGGAGRAGPTLPRDTAICDQVPRSSRTESQIGKRAQMGYALAGTLWKSLFLEADMRKDLRLIAAWLTIPVLLGAGAAAWLLKMTPEQLAGPIFHLAFGALQLGMCLTCVAGTVVVMKLLRQRREGRA